ncbi:MAG: hypothetical protein RID18_11070 [Cytophagales bacterium]
MERDKLQTLRQLIIVCDKYGLDRIQRIPEDLKIDLGDYSQNLHNSLHYLHEIKWSGKKNEIIDDEDLIKAFKGLIFIENHKEFGLGSTTPTVRIYREIQLRGLDEDHFIATWALRNRKNPYIPFGDNGKWTGEAKNAVEYYVGCEKRKLLNKYYSAENHGHYLENKIKIFENQVEDLKSRIIDIEERYSYLLLDDSSLADKIIHDKKRSVISFYKEIEKLCKSDFVSADQLKQIYNKIGENRKKEVKDLKGLIEERINNLNS